MKVVGLDLSLTSTGVATATPTGATTIRVRTKAPEVPSIAATGQRLRYIVGRVWDIASVADLVVVEAPSYGSTGGQAHERAGLWWLTMTRLTAAHVPVVKVSPGTLKVYATGSGRATKDEVLAAVVRRHPAFPIQGNDEADALTLASMGARWLGFPIDQLPETHTRALAAVAWPDHLRGTTT